MELLDAQDRLWGRNLGGAVLHWCSTDKYRGSECFIPNPKRPALTLLYNDQFGFHIRFEATNDVDYIAINPDDIFVRVQQCICGQEAYFPSNTFHAMDVAKQIVCFFIATEERFSGVSWKDASAFRYDLPDDWKDFGIVVRTPETES